MITNPSNVLAIEKEQGTSETVSELVRRHLQNPLHQTTEEELRNAVLDLHTQVPEAASQLGRQ